MTAEKQQRLDKIDETHERLEEITKAYGKLRRMAHDDATEAFIELAETAGVLVLDSIKRQATLLDILMRAGEETE